jgi:acyl carrier protein
VAADAERTVLKAIRTLVRRKKGSDADVTLGSALHDDLMLDSLDAAELSATLEDDLGSDPYSEGVVPQTVAEVIEFYER